MSTCANCGAARSDSGPFCPVCGADGRLPLEWIGSSTPSTSSTTVVRSGVVRSKALMVGTGLVAVIALGWVALGGSGEAPAESAASSTSAVPSNGVALTTTTSPSGSETTEWILGDPSSPTTEVRSDEVVGGDPKPTGPMLGYETGLAAVGNDLNGWSFLDIDTGLRVEVELPGNPVGAVDGHLLVVDQSNAFWSIPLADLDAEPVLLSDPETSGPSQVRSSRIDGAVWVSNEWLASWRLVEVASGTVLDSVVEAAPSFGLSWGTDLLGPELVSPLSGGVFELVDDGYRRFRDGFLVSVSGGVALVSECDDQLRCEWQRYSVDDWSAVGDPIERVNDIAFAAQLFARGRLLWLSDAGTGSLIDLQTGLEPLGVRASDVRQEGSHSDGSGRFVTFRVSSEARLVDLDTGEFADLGLFGEAVLVPRSEVQSLFDSGS